MLFNIHPLISSPPILADSRISCASCFGQGNIRMIFDRHEYIGLVPIQHTLFGLLRPPFYEKAQASYVEKSYGGELKNPVNLDN